MKKIRYFFGNKLFYKEMWAIALPIALQQLISALVNILDSAMVGQWGILTLGEGGSEIFSAAVMIANRFMTTVDNLMVMMAISCTIFIAQYFGAKNKEKMQQVFGIAVVLTSFFGLAALIFGFVFSQNIILFFATSLNAGEAMTIFGKEYLSIVVFSLLFYSLSVPLTFSLRAVKRTRIPLLAASAAAVSNLFLNWVLIYVLRMGLAGAAYATIIARIIELMILIYYCNRYQPDFFGSFNKVFSFHHGLIIPILKKGSPIIFAQILTETLGILMFFIYARIDSGNAANIAAINLSARMVDLVTAFVGGMGTAAIILVGSRLGAGKLEEAKQHARWQLSYISVVSILTIAVMILFIPFVQSVYQFDEQTNRLLSRVIIIQAFALPFVFYAMNVIFITRSGGFTRAPILITNLPFLLIKIPLVVYFVYINPDILMNLSFIEMIFSWLNSPIDLIVAIFIIDKLVELVRAIIAWFVYQYAPWQKDLTQIQAQPKLKVNNV